MTIEAKLVWTEGLQFIGRAGNGPAVVMDSNDGGTGPSPMRMVLMGIAGCSAMDVISILHKKRANVTDFQINITGERADEHPKRFTHIHVEYVVTGQGIKPKAVERAIALSEEKYCSAMASVNADISHTYRIIETGSDIRQEQQEQRGRLISRPLCFLGALQRSDIRQLFFQNRTIHIVLQESDVTRIGSPLF